MWLLEGWFGDAEWIEGIYADESNARVELERLWSVRTSDHAPAWLNRALCKFALSDVKLR